MATPPPAPPSRLIWRQVRQQLIILGLVVGSVGLIAYGLAMVAAGLLAQREELRYADVALVVVPEVPSPALSEHIFDLYRHGFAREVLLLGAGQRLMQAELLTRGLPETVVQHDLDALLRTDATLRVLVVVPPAEQLRTVKQLRDQGLRVYHVPVRGQAATARDLLQSSWNYWRYVLIG